MSFGNIIAVVVLLVCAAVAASDGLRRLRVAYEWRQMDFAYATDAQRQEAIASGAFVPANVIPVGVERHEQRLFVTLPRWKLGVPASLAYIDLNDNTTQSPLLHPYPSWGAHSLLTNTTTHANGTTTTTVNTTTTTELISPFRVRADRCQRLWVLDTGTVNHLDEQPQHLRPTQLLVYDLNNDNLLRRFEIPASQLKHDSFFANIAVEVVASSTSDCADAHAYLADLGAPGLVVYSWRSDESWRVSNHYFHPDPVFGAFDVKGQKFQWDDGLFGLALTEPEVADGGANEDDSRRLYFHALSSHSEFSVPTAWLRNRTAAADAEAARAGAVFRHHGERGERGQAGATFWSRGVLFYTQPNRNALTCWRPESATANLTEDRMGVVMQNIEMMAFPNDVKVDAEGVLWVLSDNLQEFAYGELKADEVNFRVLRGPVELAVVGTACEIGKVWASTTTEHDHAGHVHEHVPPGRTSTRPEPKTKPKGRANGAATAAATSVGVAALLAVSMALHL